MLQALAEPVLDDASSTGDCSTFAESLTVSEAKPGSGDKGLAVEEQEQSKPQAVVGALQGANGELAIEEAGKVN